MSTITNNKLPDERVSNATLIRLIQWADQHNSHYVAAALCELQERRKADSEPAGYHVIKECGKVGCSVATLEEAEKTRDFWNKKWTIRPYFYSAAPAPVVPEEMPKGLAGQIVSLLAHNIGDKFLAQKIWNACRAALLQGSQPVSNCDELQVIGWLRSDYNSDDKRDPDAPLFMLGSNNPSETWGVKYMPLTGNSPVTPDGWISCSERMPAQDDWTLIYSKYGEYLAGQVQGEYVELNDGTLSWLGAALHWMPLPAAPQQGTTNL
ncbi:DUF551 domain-containing protein [Salmonella enterica subsp. diarizonae]|nr:hypothetical protein [Salmonella enterica]